MGLGLGEGQLGELDDALSFVYGERSASLDRSRPYIPQWLATLRAFFKAQALRRPGYEAPYKP